MPQENLSKHILRGIKKSLKEHSERLERRERQRQRSVERSAAPKDRHRDRDWLVKLEDEDITNIPKPSERHTSRASSEPPALGHPQSASIADTPSIGMVGTILQTFVSECLVATEDGVLRASLSKVRGLELSTTGRPVAGDVVQVTPAQAGIALITGVLPRRSALIRAVSDASRRSSAYQEQVLAANIDLVVIICSPSTPPFSPGLIDRYLVAACRDHLTPILCLNKTDLGVPVHVEAELHGYAQLGIKVARTSVLEGKGVSELQEALAGKTSLFTGHSGVGKSALLNALEPDLSLKVGRVTDTAAGQGKGRHTTTVARLVPLSIPGTFVVDSPGVRSYSIRGIKAGQLGEHFTDVARLAQECRIRGCLHCGEPDCRVEKDASHSQFLRRRLASYRKMLEELK